MNANIALYADDLVNLEVTGNHLEPGLAQICPKGSDTLSLYLTADDALRLSQLFAGLADDIRSLDDGVAA